MTLSFSVDAETCKDIIGYYGKLPKGEKSKEFVRVHKMHLGNAGITLADLDAKLDRILDQLTSAYPPPMQALTEPYEADCGEVDLSNLDGLGV